MLVAIKHASIDEHVLINGVLHKVVNILRETREVEVEVVGSGISMAHKVPYTLPVLPASVPMMYLGIDNDKIVVYIEGMDGQLTFQETSVQAAANRYVNMINDLPTLLEELITGPAFRPTDPKEIT
jgi:hypothetical protein